MTRSTRKITPKRNAYEEAILDAKVPTLAQVLAYQRDFGTATVRIMD